MIYNWYLKYLNVFKVNCRQHCVYKRQLYAQNHRQRAEQRLKGCWTTMPNCSIWLLPNSGTTMRLISVCRPPPNKAQPPIICSKQYCRRKIQCDVVQTETAAFFVFYCERIVIVKLLTYHVFQFLYLLLQLFYFYISRFKHKAAHYYF